MIMVKYLGKPVTNRNYIHKEVKSRTNSWSARYNPVQNLLSSRLLSKNLFSVDREERSLRKHENRLLRRIFGSNNRIGKWHNEELHNLYPSPNIIRMIILRRVRWVGM
jgi:hypothetical protein